MAVAPTYKNNAKAFTYTGTVGAADTYVTNGFSITAANLNLNSILSVNSVVFNTGHTGSFTVATGLLKVLDSTGTEVTNASTTLQNATFVITGFGT